MSAGTLALVSLLLTACVTAPPERTVVQGQVAPARIIVYPAQGQSPEQTERDRYECHVWAVQQSGYDPSRPGASTSERVVVQPATPPGANTAIGAIAGAIIGSVLVGPRDAGFGVVAGGLTGAAIGASTDAQAQAQAGAEQRAYDRGYDANAVGGSNYRRAIGACLEARGYRTG
ncbi:MAG TPA: hypothetical protein VN859_00890 [Steroidobacteraceae bacterium]|nr:hypothetical protein [Steroidobacteraceae bacterium]